MSYPLTLPEGPLRLQFGAEATGQRTQRVKSFEAGRCDKLCGSPLVQSRPEGGNVKKRFSEYCRWIVFALGFALLMGGGRAAHTEDLGQPVARSYVLGVSDQLGVSLWKNAELSSKTTVRPDGRISVPLVGELEVAGMSPAQLQVLLTQKYEEFISVPMVTVLVEQINSRKFYILGEIGNPGAYDLLQPLTLMQALALAGGFTDYAKKDQVLILRGVSGRETRIMANVKSITSGKSPGDNLALLPHDTIIVP